jgi:hypothetical protein
LVAGGRVVEIAVPSLTRTNVRELIDERFLKHELPEEFIDLLYTQTGANPLFITNTMSLTVSNATLVDVYRDGVYGRLPTSGRIRLHAAQALSALTGAYGLIGKLSDAERLGTEKGLTERLSFVCRLMG